MANGNLNTTATATAFNDAARLVEKSHDVLAEGSTLLRCQPHMDATVADALIAALETQGFTLPASPVVKADGQQYAGRFVRSKLYMTEPSDQETGPREVTVYEGLTKIHIVATEADLPPPIEMARKEILDAFSLEEGTREMIGYKYVNLDPTARAALMALDITPPTDYLEKDRRFDVEEAGNRTGTLLVLFFKMTWNAFNEASPDHTSYDNYGTEHQRITEEWYNVTVENGSALSALYTGDTDYNVMRVNIRDNKNGSMDVTREQWHEAIGEGSSELEAERIKLMNPHALQYGTLNRLTVINENMSATATAYATPTGGVGSWILVDTYEEFTQNGLWNKYYIYETVVWREWGKTYAGGASTAADTTAYDNAGTANERERITKTWLGVRKADIATAIAAIRTGDTGYTPESGYIITNAGVRDNQDGSITLVQVQKKQVNNKDAGTSAAAIIDAVNPHGWDGGTISAIHTHYEHFTAAGLAAAISGEAAPTIGGVQSVLAQVHETIDGDGLYSRVYRYEVPSFTNTSGSTPNKGLANTRTLGWRNMADPGGTPVEGLDVKLIDGGDGIPIAGLAEILGNQTPTSGYSIDALDISDNHNGSGNLRRTQTKQRGTGDNFYRHWVAANGRQEEQETVLWKNLTDENATTLYNNAKTYSTNLAHASATPVAPAGHKLRSVDRIPHDNGLFDVLRVSFIPRFTGGGRIDGADTDEEPWRLYYDTFTDKDGFGSIHKLVRIDRRITSTPGTAYTYANLSSNHPVLGYKLGKVEYGNRGEWIAYKMRTEDTAVATTFAFDWSTWDDMPPP